MEVIVCCVVEFTWKLSTSGYTLLDLVDHVRKAMLKYQQSYPQELLPLLADDDEGAVTLHLNRDLYLSIENLQISRGIEDEDAATQLFQLTHGFCRVSFVGCV